MCDGKLRDIMAPRDAAQKKSPSPSNCVCSAIASRFEGVILCGSTLRKTWHLSSPTTASTDRTFRMASFEPILTGNMRLIGLFSLADKPQLNLAFFTWLAMQNRKHQYSTKPKAEGNASSNGNYGRQSALYPIISKVHTMVPDMLL